MRLDDEYMLDCMLYSNYTVQRRNFYPITGAESISIDATTGSSKKFYALYCRRNVTGDFYKAKMELYSEYDGTIYLYKDLNRSLRKRHASLLGGVWRFSFLPNNTSDGLTFERPHDLFSVPRLLYVFDKYLNQEAQTHFKKLIEETGADQLYAEEDHV